ncbi:MAG: O-antigen ligase family protein [Anaeromyxobacteraceae bacterium]
MALAWVSGLGLAGALAIVVGNGNPALAFLPLVLAGVLALVAFQPLRRTLLVVAFLALVLENPAESFGSGLWKSPIATLGALYLMQLKQTIGGGLIVTGLDLALALVAFTWLVRRMRGSTIDAGGQVATASPIVWAAGVCYATIAFMEVYGIARGGSFASSLWQLFRVIYLPGVVLLFAAALRGGRDAPALGRLMVIAALYRAVLAIVIRWQFPDLEQMPHATTHADSMLFANACVLVVANLYERPGKQSAWTAVGVLPVVLWGMVANNRRLVWVELLMALAVLTVLTGWSPIKRRMSQAAILALPFFLVYVAVGWSHPTGPFAPVKTIRSVVDSDSDSSTKWRDWENYNLYATFAKNPLVGSGYGHEYDEVVHLPDISANYELYRLAPHNSVLGIMAYGGAVGFAGLFLMIPIGMFFAVRSYRRAIAARDRIASLTAIGVFVTYLNHCYGDMALGTYTSVVSVGAALALVGKLAVSTGAWPVGAPRSAGPVPP